MGCVLQGVTSECFVCECALRVLFKGRRNDGEIKVKVKCGGEKAGNMLLKRTRRLIHNNHGALVNVPHDDEVFTR